MTNELVKKQKNEKEFLFVLFCFYKCKASISGLIAILKFCESYDQTLLIFTIKFVFLCNFYLFCCWFLYYVILFERVVRNSNFN